MLFLGFIEPSPNVCVAGFRLNTHRDGRAALSPARRAANTIVETTPKLGASITIWGLGFEAW
jgi:hypothetical protein